MYFCAILEGVVVQLPLGVRRVQNQERQQEHSLIPALEVLQQLFGLRAVGGEVGGDDVHVVPGTDRLFLLLDLALVQIRDFPLDGLDGADLIHRLHMEIDDNAALHIQKVRQHPVIQLRGQDLHKADRTQLFPHAETPAGLELKGAGGDKVLGGQTGRCQPVPGEAERFLLIHAENIVHHPQPVITVQDGGHDAQPLEVVEEVRFDTLQPGLCRTEAVSVDAEGEILGLDKAVVASGKLVLEHLRVFGADAVELVALGRDGDALGEALLGCGEVHKGELELHGAVKVIQEITPRLKDGGLVLVLRELVVDVLVLDGLGVMRIGDAADTVGPHTLIGDAVLRRLLFLIRPVRSGDGGLDLFSFGAGQLFCRGQFDTPPGLSGPAVPKRRRNCWSYRGAVSASESTPG